MASFGGQFGQQGFGGQWGFQGGQARSTPSTTGTPNDKANLIDNNNGRLNYAQMQEQRQEPGHQQGPQAKVQAQQLGSALTNVDPDFIERARAADELGQPARYTIDQKVSLPRQQSVMLPILDEEIEATKVSIYNERVHAVRPLHGLKIKNKTKQALMSGPVTVYEGDHPYSGDARLLDLQPNEERYLSYALDTGVEIKPFDVVRPGPEMTAKMENGQLNVQYKLRHTRTYVIVNRSPEDRKVVVEQPVRTGWKLVKPEKPAELTDGPVPLRRRREGRRDGEVRSERGAAADRPVRDHQAGRLDRLRHLARAGRLDRDRADTGGLVPDAGGREQRCRSHTRIAGRRRTSSRTGPTRTGWCGSSTTCRPTGP